MSKVGWGHLYNSRKWHFFGEDGRSLCGAWARLDGNKEAELGNNDSKDNCAACKRKVLESASAPEATK